MMFRWSVDRLGTFLNNVKVNGVHSGHSEPSCNWLTFYFCNTRKWKFRERENSSFVTTLYYYLTLSSSSLLLFFALIATTARGQSLWRTHYWSTDSVYIQFVYNLKLLHRHACKCWLTGNIWYAVCIGLHTKFHTPGTYGHCLLLQNRKLIKYS